MELLLQKYIQKIYTMHEWMSIDNDGDTREGIENLFSFDFMTK